MKEEYFMISQYNISKFEDMSYVLEVICLSPFVYTKQVVTWTQPHPSLSNSHGQPSLSFPNYLNCIPFYSSPFFSIANISFPFTGSVAAPQHALQPATNVISCKSFSD